MDLNKFENRIVKFKRISEGVEKVSHAEIRRIDYDTTSALPRSVTARFVGPPLNAIMTLNYDESKKVFRGCLLYTSPSPRDRTRSRMPSSA